MTPRHCLAACFGRFFASSLNPKQAITKNSPGNTRATIKRKTLTVNGLLKIVLFAELG